MRTDNYAAWELDSDAFDALRTDERLAFLVRFAVLAPSSHNSQPWKFIVGTDGVTVAPEPARFLPESDADHRQLYISLGCAIENLVLAADHYGYRTEVARSDIDGHVAWLVRVTGDPLPSDARKKDHPALSIPRRQTIRGPYEARMPEADFLDELRAPSAPDLQVHLIENEEKRARVAEAVSKALVEAMDGEAFREELSHYIHPNVTRAKIGMPMNGFGMPTILSFIAPFLVRKVNVNKASRKRDEELLSKHTPLFGVISTEKDDPEAWMQAGRRYERITLEGERRGINTAPMAAAIQIGEYHKALQEILGTDFRPQVFFRIGYAAPGPRHRSPRLEASGVIVKKTS